MLAKVCSAALTGIDAYPVEVEVNAGYGDTLIIIVGLPDAAVKGCRCKRIPRPRHNCPRQFRLQTSHGANDHQSRSC